MTSVEFHVPVSLNETFSHMMYFLTKSIDRFAQLGNNYKIVFTVSLDSSIDVSSDLLSWARIYPVEFRYCESGLWDHYKHRAEELGRREHVYSATFMHQLAYRFEADVIIFMDADTLVCGSLAAIVDRASSLDKVFGWPAWQPPPIDLMAVVREIGCTHGEFGLTYSGYGWSFMEPESCPPYFNFGFVVMNKTVSKVLLENLSKDYDFVTKHYPNNFEAQIALCLSVIRANLEYEALPGKYNYGNGDRSFPIHPKLGVTLFTKSLANF